MEIRNDQEFPSDAVDDKGGAGHSRDRNLDLPSANSPQPVELRKRRMTRFLNQPLVMLAILLTGLILTSLLANWLVWAAESSVPLNQQMALTAAESAATDAAKTGDQPAQSDSSFLSRIAEATEAGATEKLSWAKRVSTLTFRLALAALLAAMLAFRPHKLSPTVHRNPYVAQTQILLAVVAAALMMIVSDNAARAFGIFAAASLIRFRTSIRDPKEITVLLISLGIGLAAGVGRWELAIIFSLFVLLLLRLLEHQESSQVFRALELKVKTHQVESTDKLLREMFTRRNLNVEIVELNREDKKHPLGKIVYSLSMHPDLNADRMGEEIFSSDPDNIDSVEWQQKKTSSYLYR